MRKRERVEKCAHCGGQKASGNRKYCSNACQQSVQRLAAYALIEKHGRIVSGGWRLAQRYLRDKQGERCAICGLTQWLGRAVPLVMDHVDGNSDNWQLPNLRLICPNCDAQLPTFKNRNKGNGRAWRRERYRKVTVPDRSS